MPRLRRDPVLVRLLLRGPMPSCQNSARPGRRAGVNHYARHAGLALIEERAAEVHARAAELAQHWAGLDEGLLVLILPILVYT